jgi:hypothetical protein
LGHGELKTATKKSIKKTATKKAPAKKTGMSRPRNSVGQKWTEEGVFMTLRLPASTELELRKYVLMKGDLSLVVLFALDHINPKEVEIIRTRKQGLEMGRPMMLSVGTKVRNDLKAWAESKKASINAVVMSVLEKFFDLVRSKPKLDEELRMELRARRGL